jgi:hypothetical protein
MTHITLEKLKQFCKLANIEYKPSDTKDTIKRKVSKYLNKYTYAPRYLTGLTPSDKFIKMFEIRFYKLKEKKGKISASDKYKSSSLDKKYSSYRRSKKRSNKKSKKRSNKKSKKRSNKKSKKRSNKKSKKRSNKSSKRSNKSSRKSSNKKISRYTKDWNKKYGEKSITLSAKSKISGVPLSILKKVYNKGLAAWRGGSHRPGASQHQWGVSRVNSFLTCGKTWYFPDHKLAKEAMNKSPKARNFWSKKKCVKSKMGIRSRSR